MNGSPALVPAAFVTVMLTGPAAFAGVVKTSWVPSVEIESGTRPTVSPIETVEPGVKAEPATVTTVPPPTGPSAGVAEISTGASAGAGR